MQIENIITEVKNLKCESQNEAQALVKQLAELVYATERKMAEIAVDHRVEAYLSGPYGASRWVVLARDEDTDEITETPDPNYSNYNDYSEGDWQTSAGSC